jgi:phosphoglycolate phosphatase-like HAD superfamily hydrolase
MSTILVLWDIDHTLIDNHGVNKETYACAFELLTCRRAEHLALTEGRTQPAIMRKMLLRRQRGHELPGARDALASLQSRPEIVQSVLTGNIKPNAVTKLSAFGLDGYIDFEVGGYGSDDEARDKLVGIAQERAVSKYDIKFGMENTVIIGDTPRDVQAGRDGGARVVAVASGSDSAEALLAAGADIVLPDLRDTSAVVAAVTSFSGLGVLGRSGWQN